MRRLVDESFVPANQQTSVLYCRLSDFKFMMQYKDQIVLSKLTALKLKSCWLFKPIPPEALDTFCHQYITWQSLEETGLLTMFLKTYLNTVKSRAGSRLC